MINRVGIVTTWFDRGASYISRAYRDSLLELGYEVFIYARGGEKISKGDSHWDVGNVYWAKRLPVTQIDNDEFFSWYEKNSIDLVIFNEQQDWGVIDFCKSKNILTSAYIDYYKKDSVSLFDKYDALICNTQRHYSVFKDHNNCHFIQWGTNPNIFTKKEKPDHLKDNFVFFHNAGMWGVNGRKGTRELIDAFSRVLNRHTHTKLFIHSQISVQSKHPQVIIHCETVKPPSFYHYGDVYVYPSKLEGIGLSIPEAMSCGLPVITTNNGPMNEFVEDGRNGMLIKVSNFQRRSDNYYWDESLPDVNHLAQLMDMYIQQPHIVKIHGDESRRRILEEFNWNDNGKKLDQVIKSIN